MYKIPRNDGFFHHFLDPGHTLGIIGEYMKMLVLGLMCLALNAESYVDEDRNQDQATCGRNLSTCIESSVRAKNYKQTKMTENINADLSILLELQLSREFEVSVKSCNAIYQRCLN